MTRLLGLLLLAASFSCSALTAEAYLVSKLDGTVLLEKNADEVRPIASITKLFVAEQAVKLDPDELIMVTKGDMQNGRMRSTPLKVGKSYTRKQLTELALVSSDNVAALALSRSASPDTQYATLLEGSGLNPGNTSTARQLTLALQELYLTEVGPISIETKTEVGSRHSTNPLLTKAGWDFLISKTGFINSSGGCLAVLLRVKGELISFVVLGARNTKERWSDLIELRRMIGDTDFYVPVKVTKVRRRSKR
jgi:D-alanyl-D-alanine carboxypeptidase/D-alanyl-D-alanine endopeptidase (penicillin-binding protein 7)